MKEMSEGEYFERLSRVISENTSYQLNENGLKLIRIYHTIIYDLERILLPVMNRITRDPANMSKQAAIQIVSSINSSKMGSEQFDIMSRLDTLTNGGKTPIQGGSFTFNSQDKILQYLEKVPQA